MINPVACETLGQLLLFLDDQADDLHALLRGAETESRCTLTESDALRELLDKREIIIARMDQFIAHLQEVMPGTNEVATTTEYQTT